MIEVSEVTKRYRRGLVPAVRGVSFNVSEGEVVGFLGPNGAGKTTMMNIITGCLTATSGSVRVAGSDVLEEPLAAKRHIGYLPENPPLYPDMTVEEYLDAVCDLKRVRKSRRAHLEGICRQTGLAPVSGRLIKNLSKGYRQRVGIAQALTGDPSVIILDEPTSGLDPAQIIEIRSLIRELGKSRTVILSTHILPEVSAICGRILIISGGVTVADGSPGELAERYSQRNKIALRIHEAPEEAEARLCGIPGVLSASGAPSEAEPSAFEYTVEAEPGTDIRPALTRVLAEADIPILMLRPLELGLEEVFIKLTSEIQEENQAGNDKTQEENQPGDGGGEDEN